MPLTAHHDEHLFAFMAPRMDIDWLNANPEMSRCLRDLVPLYIRHYRLAQPEQQLEVINEGAESVIRSFDKLFDEHYDRDACIMELKVCMV
jgi:hypothetical protein